MTLTAPARGLCAKCGEALHQIAQGLHLRFAGCNHAAGDAKILAILPTSDARWLVRSGRMFARLPSRGDDSNIGTRAGSFQLLPPQPFDAAIIIPGTADCQARSMLLRDRNRCAGCTPDLGMRRPLRRASRSDGRCPACYRRRAPAHGPGLVCPAQVYPKTPTARTALPTSFSTITQARCTGWVIALLPDYLAEQDWPPVAGDAFAPHPHTEEAISFWSGPNPRRKDSALGLFRGLARHPDGRRGYVVPTHGRSLFCLLQLSRGDVQQGWNGGRADKPPAGSGSGCSAQGNTRAAPYASDRPGQCGFSALRADDMHHRPLRYRHKIRRGPRRGQQLLPAPDTAGFSIEAWTGKAKFGRAQLERLYHGFTRWVFASSTISHIPAATHGGRLVRPAGCAARGPSARQNGNRA